MSLSTRLNLLAERMGAEVGLRELSENKGKPSGHASLNRDGRVPMEQLDVKAITKPTASVIKVLSSETAYCNTPFEMEISVRNYTEDDSLELLPTSTESVATVISQRYDTEKNVIYATVRTNLVPDTYTISFTRFGQSYPTSNTFDVIEDVWTDLREGNNLPSIRTAGTTVHQSPHGVWFEPKNTTLGWGNWVKFEELQWKRSTNSTLEFVMQLDPSVLSPSFMIGMGSTETNERSIQQYWEGEQLLYLNTDHTHQCYGGGPWANWSLVTSYEFDHDSPGYYKFKFVENGKSIEIYYLPANKESWINGGTKLHTFNIDSMRPNPASCEDLMLMIVAPQSTELVKLAAYRVY